MTKPIQHSFTGFEVFAKCPKQFHDVRIAKLKKEEDNEASLAGKRDHKSFEDRLRDGVALPSHLLKHEPKVQAMEQSGSKIVPEEEFAVDRQLHPVGWWDDTVWLRVKNDVSLYQGSKAAAFDWKTGKRYPKFFQLELAAAMQMVHHPEVDEVKSAFVWLKEDTLDPKAYTRQKNLTPILDKTLEKATEIEEAAKEGVWKAKPGPHCKWCPMKNDCAYSQA